MATDRTHILVLNYNGRALLDECLPSVVAAARNAPVPCDITVVDNGSTDGSLDALAENWPEVGVVHRPNLGLASLNDVVARLSEPVVLLLNNDVKLAKEAIAPLLQALDAHDDAFFAAPQCWTFDGRDFEGMRTRVRMRFGLVQGMCRVPGFERQVNAPGLTAAAGPVLAVNRRRFVELGGYDPIYHPGRIEDLDLGFRAWLRGWKGYYVPESLAWHKGFGSFGPVFGQNGCDSLAARNTLIFTWKNLGPARLVAHIAWLPARIAWVIAAGRPGFLGALLGAVMRLPEVMRARRRDRNCLQRRERENSFFREFAW